MIASNSDAQRDGRASFRSSAGAGEHAVANMLPPDADDVAAPLPGIEPERQR